MNPRQALPAEWRDAPFRVGEALRAGVGEGRLRGHDLARPFWGVRAPSPPRDLVDICSAYLARAHPSVFFSHGTAAKLWGIRLPGRFRRDADLDVGVPWPKRAQVARGIRGHKLRLDAADLTMRIGMPVTSPERTWCDLAAWLSDEELLAAGDSLLWWRRPLAMGPDVDAAFRRHTGRGAAALRRVGPQLCDRSDSSPESVFRWRFRAAGLPAPAVNLQLYDRAGHRVAMPDLAFLHYREAFDYEGDHHRTDPAQWQKDIKRVPRLEAIGWHHTRGAAEDLRDSTELIGLLAERLRAKGWPG